MENMLLNWKQVNRIAFRRRRGVSDETPKLLVLVIEQILCEEDGTKLLTVIEGMRVSSQKS